MNAALGHGGVVVALAASIVGAAVIGFGLMRGRNEVVRSGRIYALIVLAGSVIATFAMERALLTHDFSLDFVASNSSRATPLLYTITGMWSALEGSILLWALILAAYIVAMVWRFRKRSHDPLVGWATLIAYMVAAFFFALMVGPADPFRTVAGAVPADGVGPNVLLQDNPLVAFHPPILYSGFVGLTVPFAFAIASLITGRIEEGWQQATRKFTLFAWAFLTVGIMLGAWWSYQVLGWGGFWAWDPVENAAFLPWLCATAYLHSAVAEERRGSLRVWNLSLVIAAFALTILGTFLTRSGVLQSVHAFSNSATGPLLLGFFGAVVALGIGLIAWRGDRLRSPQRIEGLSSREGAFLLNNLLFVGFAFVVLLGTVFPLLYQAMSNQQVTVGSPYFDTMTLPIGLGLLFLMAIGPALPWGKTTATTLRDRLAMPLWMGALVMAASAVAGVHGVGVLCAFGLAAVAAASNVRQLVLSARSAHRAGLGPLRGLVGKANGGMIVHLGVVVIAVALASATTFGHRGEVSLHPRSSATFDGHSIYYQGIATTHSADHDSIEALVKVDGHGPYRPAVSTFGDSTEAVGTPAVDSGAFDDVYLTVNGLPASRADAVRVGVIVQPLVSWLWIGGSILVLGVIMAAVPQRRRWHRRWHRRVLQAPSEMLEREEVLSATP